MESVIKLIIGVVIFVSTFYVFSNLGKGSVTMSSNSSGATMVSKDMFGNTTTCRTEIIGSSSYTSCN